MPSSPPSGAVGPHGQAPTDTLHVYSPPKENFFCIEPVSNVRDAYLVMKNSKLYNGLKIIKPNQSFESAVEFKILN